TGADGWTNHAFTCMASQPNCQLLVSSKSEVMLASYDTTGKNYDMPQFLAADGGQVQLVDADGQIQDMVGYGSAAAFEGSGPAPMPQTGHTIVRLADTDTGDFIDSNDNAKDFALPQATQVGITSTDPAPGQGAAPTVSYPKVLITELLPDPASPATDANDEYVELYNPNNNSVDLAGYTLQSGTNWRYKFTIPELVLNPDSYVALYAAQTKLTLSNSGTEVRLLDPSGMVVDQVSSYGTAKTGQGWMVDTDGAWQWTSGPTPGAPNNLVMVASSVKTTTTTKTTAAKSTKTTVTKKATAAVTKPKSTTTKNTTAVASPIPPSGQIAQATSPTNYWFIGGAIALVGGYAIYEYRADISMLANRVRDKLFKHRRQPEA
ncbi:MAG TPA: lamin tail domain-containing protein, partial [Candidatus Acidoferrum sp.]|nr:lamin tail domain-containing protein [Candidatus Acidoferrum sp.]